MKPELRNADCGVRIAQLTDGMAMRGALLRLASTRYPLLTPRYSFLP
jgi:hypothetical protein